MVSALQIMLGMVSTRLNEALAVGSSDEGGGNIAYLPCSFTIKLPKMDNEHEKSFCKSIFHSPLFANFSR